MEKKQVDVGDEAPEFCLPDQNDVEACLTNLRGHWVALYFYPRDNTKGCTLEALDFTASLKDFEQLQATVLGVSPDSTESHRKFADKQELKHTLLSDEEHKVLEDYGVWQLKKMYGKEYMGVVRSTFLIDPEGIIRYTWRKVNVKGHVDAVKQRLSELQLE